MHRILVLALLIACVSTAQADSVFVSTTIGKLLSIDTATGTQSEFGNVFAPSGLTIAGGNLYVASNGDPALGTHIAELSPAGVPIPNSYGSTFVTLEGIAADQHGNIFAGDFTFGGVAEFAKNGSVIGFGDSTPEAPRGLAFDSQGNLYVATSNDIMRYTPGGVGSVFATTGGNQPWGMAFDSHGNLFVANASANTIEEYTPGGVGSVFASTGLSTPKGLAFDSMGDLFVANYGNSTIEEFTANGTGSLFATLDTAEGAPIYLAIGVSSVPEPGSLILLGVGVLGALALGRRAGR
jgi:PEP-CTERM motif